jgi:Kef-type K+ transport system membrane component KefB
MDKDNLDVKLALEEMRLNMQQSMSAGDALDQKVEFVLVVAGLALGLATTLQAPSSPSQFSPRWFVLLAAMAFYVISVLAILVSSMPQTYHLAIASEWEELKQRILGRAEREAILTVLSGYVNQIQHNEKLNRRKAKLHVFSLCVLMVTVILIVTLAFTQ